MLSRWLFYVRLAVSDLIRLRQSVQLHVFIVAGICLPIMVLLGLKAGHIEELERDLRESPTGRQVNFWAAQKGDLLTLDGVKKLETEIDGLSIIIPVSERLGLLSSKNSAGEVIGKVDVEFRSTSKGNPLLAVEAADVLESGEHAIVLLQRVADTLGVRQGGDITLSVTRGQEGERETHSVNVRVKAIIASEEHKGQVAYIDLQIANLIQHYVDGAAVPEFGWPATRKEARDKYSEYLVFAELKPLDKEKDEDNLLAAGFRIEQVKDEADATRGLFGLISESKLKELYVYRVWSGKSRVDPTLRLLQLPEDIREIMTHDGTEVLRWNSPHKYRVAGHEFLLVGCSMGQTSWLRKLYIREEGLPFDYDTDTLSIRLVSGAGGIGYGELPLQVDDNLTISVQRTRPALEKEPPPPPLEKEPPPPPPLPRPVSSVDVKRPNTPGKEPPRIAIVPDDLLAYLDAYRNGQVEHSRSTKLFIPSPPPIVYDEFQGFAEDINHVLSVYGELEKRGYSPTAETTLIKEIQKNSESLNLLVLVVGGAVFVFGVFTVMNVLHESTDRKRATIGILRVMGISREGVFLLVFGRAVVIGLIAGGLTLSIGFVFAAVMTWDPDLQARFDQLLEDDPKARADVEKDSSYKETLLKQLRASRRAELNSAVQAGDEPDEPDEAIAKGQAADGGFWRWKVPVAVRIEPADFLLVFFGAILCCVVGSLAPAVRAARLDPFEAIVEGRFR